MLSLAGEDPEHIPIERNMLANLVSWEILACISDERVDRALELIAGTVPIQTIVPAFIADQFLRSEEHTSELQSRGHLVCRLLLEKKKTDLYNSAAHINK